MPGPQTDIANITGGTLTANGQNIDLTGCANYNMVNIRLTLNAWQGSILVTYSIDGVNFETMPLLYADTDSNFGTLLNGTLTHGAPTTSTIRLIGATRGAAIIRVSSTAFTAGTMGVDPKATIGDPAVLTPVTLFHEPKVVSGGYTLKPTVTFTRAANTTPYTINDEVGTSGTAPSTFIAARNNGGTGFILGCEAVFMNNPATTPSLRVWIFSATVTLAGDNAALALSDAHALNYLGSIDLSLVQQVNGAGGTAAATIYKGSPDSPIAYQCGASEKTLYAFVTTLNAWTPIANSETLQIAFDCAVD